MWSDEIQHQMDPLVFNFWNVFIRIGIGQAHPKAGTPEKFFVYYITTLRKVLLNNLTRVYVKISSDWDWDIGCRLKVCQHCYLECSWFRYRLYYKWQYLQTPNVNICWNSINLSINSTLYLNLNPISQSQSELLRMHTRVGCGRKNTECMQE